MRREMQFFPVRFDHAITATADPRTALASAIGQYRHAAPDASAFRLISCRRSGGTAYRRFFFGRRSLAGKTASATGGNVLGSSFFSRMPQLLETIKYKHNPQGTQ